MEVEAQEVSIDGDYTGKRLAFENLVIVGAVACQSSLNSTYGPPTAIKNVPQVRRVYAAIFQGLRVCK